MSKFVTPRKVSQAVPTFKSKELSAEEQETVKKLKQQISELDGDIQELKVQDKQEQQRLKEHIDRLHEYNQLKDTAQMVFGKLSTLQQTTVGKIHEQFGVTDKD